MTSYNFNSQIVLKLKNETLQPFPVLFLKMFFM